ncbi:hypothetical protein DLM78_22720 [Leptospira stimsonii]|uniref:Uncharacterized protein n=1 Tax=Leptospira stimsonii TaxID=2202203 RepID=A0A8B3CJ21_9LEPT|nr:hypothetical protein DLM78_22720 [Leptospira stimsonii]
MRKGHLGKRKKDLAVLIRGERNVTVKRTHEMPEFDIDRAKRNYKRIYTILSERQIEILRSRER